MDDLDEQVASEHIVERQCESPPFPRYEVMLGGIVAVIAGLAAFCNVRVRSALLFNSDERTSL